MVQPTDVVVEIFLVDGFKLSQDLINTADPNERASISSLGQTYTVRPYYWMNSVGGSTAPPCDNKSFFLSPPVGGAGPIPLPVPDAPGYRAPCVVDLQRLAPNKGPYFCHVWGWKRLPGQSAYVPITDLDPIAVRPRFQVIDPSDPLNILYQTVLVSTPQPFSKTGLNAMSMSKEVIQALQQVNDLTVGTNLLVDFTIDAVTADPDIETTWPFPSQLTWYNPHCKFSAIFGPFPPGGNVPDDYRYSLCPLPGVPGYGPMAYCQCPPQLRLPGSNVCSCIDPDGYRKNLTSQNPC